MAQLDCPLSANRRHSAKLIEKKEPPIEAAFQVGIAMLAEAYFNAVETVVKVVFKLTPRPFTVAIIAMEIPAAIRPYSMAVAPSSFQKNAYNFDIARYPFSCRPYCDTAGRGLPLSFVIRFQFLKF
jgi:hypothetical protein